MYNGGGGGGGWGGGEGVRKVSKFWSSRGDTSPSPFAPPSDCVPACDEDNCGYIRQFNLLKGAR